jgi:hypothetical protein
VDNAVDQGGKVLEQYSVMSAWPIPGLRPVEFYVSETLFHSGRYALFARTDRGMEIWLAGTFHSEDEALNIAAGLLSRADSSDPSKPLVSLVSRSKSWGDEWYGKFEKDSLLDVLKDHFKGQQFPNSLKDVKDKVLEPRSLFGIVVFCAIVSFLFGVSIWVPKEVQIPLLGEAVSGKTLGPSQIANYLPAALLILYVLMQFAGSRRGKNLNNARRAILELVRRYGYGRADLESFFQKNFVQKQSGDIMLSWERFLGKALGVLPWRDKQAQPEDAAEAAKRTETWKRFLESDFDRRIHNLAMMDSQPAFRPFMTCFDPVLYLITTNRLRWTQYVEARKRGFNAPDIPLGVNPDTVDIRGKAALWLPCFAVVGLGLPLAWSLWRLEGATTDIYAQNIGMSVVLITAVVVWPYLAVARRWGFPAAEPIGVYTEDFVQRPLLTF